MSRVRRHPPHGKIVAAQLALLSSLPDGPDATEATTVCWACGAQHDGGLVRAHIVPVRNGGSDAPGNFFLLCDRCHDEQPDHLALADQLSWLRRHEAQVTRIEREVAPMVQRLLAAGVDQAALEAYMADKSEQEALRAGLTHAATRSTFEVRLLAFARERA